MTDPRNRSEWYWRRMEAIIRDNYECQECGALGGRRGDTRLHVHHETPVSDGGENDPENLVTLCPMCHVGHPGKLVPTAESPGDTPCPHPDCDRELQGEDGVRSHYARVHGKPYPWRDWGYETLTCEQCGDEYEKPADEADGSRFCSRKCLNQYQSETRRK